MQRGPAARQTFLYREGDTTFCVWANSRDVAYADGRRRVHIRANGGEIVLRRDTPDGPWVRQGGQH